MSEKQHHPRSVKGFCQRNDISRQCFYDQVNAGKLRIRKIGAKTIVTPDDEQEWLANLPTTLNEPRGRGRKSPAAESAAETLQQE